VSEFGKGSQEIFMFLVSNLRLYYCPLCPNLYSWKICECATFFLPFNQLTWEKKIQWLKAVYKETVFYPLKLLLLSKDIGISQNLGNIINGGYTGLWFCFHTDSFVSHVLHEILFFLDNDSNNILLLLSNRNTICRKGHIKDEQL